jgi:hypothetical protein
VGPTRRSIVVWCQKGRFGSIGSAAVIAKGATMKGNSSVASAPARSASVTVSVCVAACVWLRTVNVTFFSVMLKGLSLRTTNVVVASSRMRCCVWSTAPMMSSSMPLMWMPRVRLSHTVPFTSSTTTRNLWSASMPWSGMVNE